MAVTLETVARNAACDAIVDLLDLGSAVTYPVLEFKTSAGTSTRANGQVAELEFTGATAFGASSTGTSTAGTIASDTNADGGTTAKAYLYDQDSAPVLTCSVTATGGGGDIELSSVAIGAGDTVSVSALTVTVPAS